MFSFKKSHKAVFPLWWADNCFFKWCIKLCALDFQTLDCKMPQYERLMGLGMESGQIHCFHKPSWDTRSSGKRWAAFPTLFNSLSKAPDFVPMYSLLNLILVYLNKWHIGIGFLCSFKFWHSSYDFGEMASVNILPGLAIWGWIKYHFNSASSLPSSNVKCLFSNFQGKTVWVPFFTKYTEVFDSVLTSSKQHMT